MNIRLSDILIIMTFGAIGFIYSVELGIGVMAFFVLLKSLAIYLYKKRVVYENYEIKNDSLKIYSDKETIIIKYYDISDMWIDEKNGEIDININEDLKKTGEYIDKLTKGFIIKSPPEKIALDFQKIMKMAQLKINMGKEESEKRLEKIMDLYKSGRISEF